MERKPSSLGRDADLHATFGSRTKRFALDRMHRKPGQSAWVDRYRQTRGEAMRKRSAGIKIGSSKHHNLLAALHAIGDAGIDVKQQMASMSQPELDSRQKARDRRRAHKKKQKEKQAKEKREREEFFKQMISRPRKKLRTAPGLASTFRPGL